MVADRWKSLLTQFNDTELAACIVEIDRRHTEPVLEFNDSFVFILAHRPICARATTQSNLVLRSRPNASSPGPQPMFESQPPSPNLLPGEAEGDSRPRSC
ncbi:hypothetical protein, partial [Actinomadura sp. SCN-SB]|uniref:hypothetical protein n=1 Tax=Actinomadura sp. SCN-SB TaxID=3373092 RepID=UPI0037517DA5